MTINRELLEKQFTGTELKTRKGNFGESIDYVETQLIIQRLNDALDQLWSFKIISHERTETEVIVLGELSTCGITKQQFGTSKITVNKKTGEVVSIGDDLKAATSDSLKKCASLMGVALHIYGDSLPDQPEGKKNLKDMAEENEIKPKTETIPTANGVELPLDEPTEEKEYDNFKTHRAAYFATEIIGKMSDEERYQWNMKYIKKASIKDFTMRDWNKAVELARLQSQPMTFTETGTGAELPPLDGKKELPNMQTGLRQTAGGTRPASKSQLELIQRLLEQKDYFTTENTKLWTIAKAIKAIEYLKSIK